MAPTENNSCEQRIEELDPRKFNVASMRQLLCDLTSQEKWIKGYHYQAFTTLRKDKVIGKLNNTEEPLLDPRATDFDIPNPNLPSQVADAAEKFGVWLKGLKTEERDKGEEAKEGSWYLKGAWMQYPTILEWHIWQEVQHKKHNWYRAKREDNVRTAARTAGIVLDEVENSDMQDTFFDPIKGWTPRK